MCTYHSQAVNIMYYKGKMWKQKKNESNKKKDVQKINKNKWLWKIAGKKPQCVRVCDWSVVVFVWISFLLHCNPFVALSQSIDVRLFEWASMNNRWMVQKKRIRCRERKATEYQIWALIWAFGPVCLWISLNKMPYWCALYRSFVLSFFFILTAEFQRDTFQSINHSFVRSFFFCI